MICFIKKEKRKNEVSADHGWVAKLQWHQSLFSPHQHREFAPHPKTEQLIRFTLCLQGKAENQVQLSSGWPSVTSAMTVRQWPRLSRVTGGIIVSTAQRWVKQASWNSNVASIFIRHSFSPWRSGPIVALQGWERERGKKLLQRSLETESEWQSLPMAGTSPHSLNELTHWICGQEAGLHPELGHFIAFTKYKCQKSGRLAVFNRWKQEKNKTKKKTCKCAK